jgi:hypothetical protein
MVFTYTAAEPSQPKSIISLCSIDIRFRRGIEGLKIIAGIFKGNPSFALELLMIPFCDLCMGKDGVITTGDAGRETTGYAMVSGVVPLAIPCRIVFVLPVAILS